jgi:glycosyltransferase involved in cell wall biosynthesis
MAVEAFSQTNRTNQRRPIIGMAARLAAEKGVEVLLESLPRIIQMYPRAQVLFAGQYEDVLGEQEYYNRLMPIIQNYQEQGHWKFLGVLDPRQMAAFPSSGVLVQLGSGGIWAGADRSDDDRLPCVAYPCPAYASLFKYRYG